MHRQGFDLQLKQYNERGWRATFYTTGMEHSPTSATGTGWERTPWHATQRAAWGGVEEVRGGQPMMRLARRASLLGTFCLLASAATLAGCVTPSTLLINDQGQVIRCSAQGWG